MTSTAKRILLIAYHFPPSAAVGGVRMANFARSLTSYGWEPHVLTIPQRDVKVTDPERRRGLEDIPIVTAAVLPTLDNMLSAMLRRLRPRRKPSASVDADTPPAEAQPTRAMGLSSRLKRYVLSFLLLPDHERGWILSAAVAAIRYMRRQRIGWMMTSCPPYSVHLVGLAVNTLTSKKWIVDFRDPWITTGRKRLYPTSALSLRIERWLEKAVIERASLVVFNVERLRNAYRERYRHVPPENFVFIPNAIAARPARELPNVKKYETFTLCYTGSLYLGRSPEPVFKALARLIGERRLRPGQVHVDLVGQCANIDGVPTLEVARRYGLDGSVAVRDQVSYGTAMDMVRRSHLALLFAPDLPFQIPAKVYDYLGAGTRILAIAEDGGTADLIRETDSGRAFLRDDVDGITEFIYREMTCRGSVDAARAASLARFDLGALTGELVRHIDRVSATVGMAS